MERIERRTSRRARRRQGLRLVFGTLLLGIGGVLLARNPGLEIPLSIARLELYARDSWRAVLANGTRLPVARSGHARLRQRMG
jgi:hypothetical protein